jgi:hypothetical protein
MAATVNDTGRNYQFSSFGVTRVYLPKEVESFLASSFMLCWNRVRRSPTPCIILNMIPNSVRWNASTDPVGNEAAGWAWAVDAGACVGDGDEVTGK